MSNESNREPGRSVSPSDLQASDFFPPGHGWNKEEEEASVRSASHERDRRDDESASDGARRH